jgi:hypothetical protein
MPEDLEAKVRDIVGLYLAPPPRAGGGAVRGREVHAQIQALDRIAPILPIPSRAAGVADPGPRPARHRDPVRRVGGSDREGHRRLLRSAPPPGAPGLPQAGREDLSTVTRARPHALARWRRRSSTVQRRLVPHPTRDSRHQPQRSRRLARGLPLGAVHRGGRRDNYRPTTKCAGSSPATNRASIESALDFAANKRRRRDDALGEEVPREGC